MSYSYLAGTEAADGEPLRIEKKGEPVVIGKMVLQIVQRALPSNKLSVLDEETIFASPALEHKQLIVLGETLARLGLALVVDRAPPTKVGKGVAPGAPSAVVPTAPPVEVSEPTVPPPVPVPAARSSLGNWLLGGLAVYGGWRLLRKKKKVEAA